MGRVRERERWVEKERERGGVGCEKRESERVEVVK